MKLRYLPSTYETIDFELTLICNFRCKNCIRFCGMREATGIDYSKSELTMGQVENFIDQVECVFRKTGKRVFQNMILSGGEPTLHPRLLDILKLLTTKLVSKDMAKNIWVNSNLVKEPIAEIKDITINFTTVQDKPKEHIAVLYYEGGDPTKTYFDCKSILNKNKIVFSYQGYNLCCWADGYIRLFCAEDLFLDRLPESIEGFPLDKMAKVCGYCCANNKSLFERDVGSPISDVFAKEIEKNLAGRRITKIFPEKTHI